MNIRSKKWKGWGFVLVPALLIVLFSFYPMVQSFILSLQTGRGATYHFTGFKNYVRLVSDPIFIQAVKNTLLYLVVQVPIMLFLGLIIASILNSPKLKFRSFYRTAVFLPCVTSLVGYSILFKSIFSVNGVVNKVLLSCHLIDTPIPWLLDPVWAKVIIIIAITWRWTGYNMVFYLAGMQNIDKSVYEAAEIDGATKADQFFKITIPLLRPVILFTMIASTNGTLQLFDEPMNLTAGGPGNATITISQYIYNLSFKYMPNFGYAATVAYAIVFMVAVLSIIQLKLGGQKDES